MVLDKRPVLGHPTILITVGQGPTALAVGAGGGCLDIFTLIYPFSPLSPSLRETARYRLKYCLKGPLNPKQPTNLFFIFIFYYFSDGFNITNYISITDNATDRATNNILHNQEEPSLGYADRIFSSSSPLLIEIEVSKTYT